MATEGRFQTTLYKALREDTGAVVYNIHPDIYMTSGMPDTFIGHPIWTGWLELKDLTTKIKKHQIRQLKLLLRCNVPAYSCRRISPGVIQFVDYEIDCTYKFEWDGQGWSFLKFLADKVV